MPRRALALPKRAVVPVDAEPAEVVDDLRLTALDVPGRIGVVDRSRSQSPKRRLATALSALPRCSVPVGLGANLTRIMRRE
jgi:hypothetical protein